MKKYLKFLIIFLFVALFIPINVTDVKKYGESVVNKVYADDEITDSSKLKTLSFAELENNLSPAFDSNVTEYNLSLTPNIIDVIPVYTTVSTGNDVTVTVTGNKYLKNATGDIKIKVSNPLASSDTTYTIHYSKNLDSNITRSFTFGYTGEPQEFTTTMTGMYRVELWGAQGGHRNDYNVNFGGYTSGDIILSSDTTFYVYVGAAGSRSETTVVDSSTRYGSTVFNGGGAGGIGSNPGYSGGGATDIRLVNDEWDNPESLASRIMVAGGSGGASGDKTYDNVGGHSVAGGLEGYSGGYFSGHEYVNQNGKGATQLLGGIAGSNHYGAEGENESGTFGIGGSSHSKSTTRGSGGGGGGYYGGGAGGSTGGDSGYGQGGGGGSSYISGHNGSIAVTAVDDLTPKCESATDINCSYHYSNYKFSNTQMIDGAGYSWTNTKGEQTGMPNYTGKSTITGNEGDGYAKITLLELPSDDNYLTSLTTSEGTFDEEFSPTTTTYNLTLSAYTAKFTLDGTVSDKYATVTGLTEYKIDLGETKRINIMVTSASGKTQTYKVIVTRSELELTTSSTKLKSLSFPDGYAIDFEPLKYEYNIEIAENAMEVPINAVTFDENATINIMNNEYLTSKNGTISIVVAKEGISSTTYRINYTKKLRDTSLDTYTQGYDYTGNVQTFTAPLSANYKISLWGGSGTNDAYGGYTEGTIFLTKDKEIYIYVGNHATGATNTITFNGGTSDNGGYNGGGATDVRLEKGTNWYDFDSLKTRIMVAAGGGAGTTPGAAGGLEGYNGQGSMGGTQTDVAVSDVTPSRFGVANGSCTGGNGYFPGDGSACETGAGGGSSYISGHPGVKSISESSTSDMILPTDNINHYSGYSFADTRMIDGKGYEWTVSGRGDLVGMPTFDFTSTMNGNNNGGKAIIQMTTISNDNYLTNLSANIGTFNQPFNPAIYEYDLHIDKYETKVTLDAVLSDSNATITGLGEVTLKSGETKKVTIIVTAPSGKTRNYVVNVTRDKLAEGEHNSKLYELSINGYKLDKPFSSLTYTYDTEISINKYDLDIIAMPYDSTAKVTITGNKHMINDYDVIEIKVEAEGVESTTYKIYYTKVDYSNYVHKYGYTGHYETFTAGKTGNYKIELWGASGRYSGNAGTPGLGGYTSGIISLTEGDTLYVFVGEAGNCTGSNYGSQTFNGGGYTHRCNANDVGRGGGATDVRTYINSNGSWNDFESLKSRIMVAGGGGSANVSTHGGDAGGLISYMGPGGGGGSAPATQTSGYAFGQGGPGLSSQAYSGSGSGYFGGKSSTSSPCTISYGGSSYISGHYGCNSITEASTANALSFTGSEMHYTGKYFTDTVMIDGLGHNWTTVAGTEIVGMPTIAGTALENGHVGDGYAKIGILEGLNDTLSQNAYLEDLKVHKSNYTEENLVEFDFDPIVTDYEITIDKYTRAFTVEGELSDSNAMVTGLGKYIIEPGETKNIEITVTAVDGNTKTYTIKVTRENETEHTTLLKNLQIDKYNLNEDFYSNKFDYTVNVFDVEIDLVVNSFKFDDEAVVNVSGSRYISDNTGVVTVTVKHAAVDGEDIPDSIYTITYNKITPTMDSVTFNYTGEYQTFKTPFSAKYKIELYGAAGGGGAVNTHTSGSAGGVGGSAIATFKILENTNLYFYVGGKGTYGAGSSPYGGPLGGWNGGGYGGNSGSGSGGGATDVRLVPTSAKNIWNETNSLYSRFMVSGGAGGADDSGSAVGGSNDGTGGSSGLLNGQGAWIDGTYYASYGGTQTNGYALGEGGHVTTNTDTGGAGGGYYGGTVTNHNNGGAGAGSSYIKGYPGADTTYNQYQQGVEYVEGELTQAVNTGNGYAKISMIGIISDNVYLSDLKVTTDLVEESLIDESFDPLEGNYSVYLDKYTELFFVSGTLSDQNSTVTGLGEYRIGLGETKVIPVVVTAESGKTKQYTITVTRANFREGEHSSKLSSLSLDGFTLKENFYSEKYEYTMNVYSNEIDTVWHYTTYDPDATVVISGDKYIKRSPGTITITVSAPECEDTVYEIVYTKVYTEEPSKNNYLANLETSVGELTPEFNLLKNEYTINLTSTQTGTRLTGKADDSRALVSGLDKFYKVDPGKSRTIDIVVTSDFGTPRTYTVTINRDDYVEGTPSTLLKSLVINGYETDIDFESEVFEYNIVIPKGEIDLDLIGIPYDSTAKVTYENTKHLVDNTGTITVTVTKEGLEDTVYEINYTKYDSYIEGFEYSGDYQTFKAPYTGKYTFELWGAQGGTGYYSTQPTPGKGAYTKGTINLEKDEILYIYVGGQGASSANGSSIPAAGYNGGAQGTTDDSRGDSGGAGGGATDIRTLSGKWDDARSLASRIMVAGGGGGAHSTNTTNYTEAMNAGALAVTGQISTWTAAWTPVVNQTTGYAFGYGKSGTSYIYCHAMAGGGGGYWGGQNTLDSSNCSGRASGGSSYISGYTGSVAIKSMTDITPRLDSNDEACANGTDDITCSYHYSGKVFDETQMLSGNDVQPTTDKSSYQTGNSGNGYARITMELSQDAYLNSLSSDFGEFDLEFDPLTLNYVLTLSQYESYFNLTGKVSNASATVTGLDRTYELALGEEKVIPIIVTAPNGDTKTYTVTAKRNNYTDEHSTKLKLLNVVNYENILIPKFTPITTNYEITLDDAEAEVYLDYEAFDSAATVTVTGEGMIIGESGILTATVEYAGLEPTIYTISYRKNKTPEGTKFEYGYTGNYQTFIVPTTGYYNLEVWGAQGGGRNVDSSNGDLGYGGSGGYSTGTLKLYKDTKLYIYVGGEGKTSNTDIALGGFNGGGASYASSTGDPASGGGGATDIRTEVDNLYTRFIVAGGGGGGGEDGELGGFGGGTTGGRVSSACGSNATATAGYCGAVFGIGASTKYDGGGGGGGWYGGGTGGGSQTLPFENDGTDSNGGNGGSGFVLTASTATSTPAGYKLGSEWHLTDASTIAGNDRMYSYDHNDIKYGNNGNGYAVITLLSKTSKDNYLAGLTTDYGTFNKIFNPQTQAYTLSLDSYTPQFTLTGKPSDSDSIVTGLGTYEIAPGETKNIEVVVTSTSGDTRTYKITATRSEFTDAHSTLLSKLVLTEDGTNIDIPSFNSKVFNYNIKLYSNVTNISVTGIPYDTDEKVSIAVADNKHLPATGTITVTVTHEGLEDSIYKINYTKDKSLDDYVPTENDTVTTYDYTGQYQTFTAPSNGKYIVELWGAEGNAPTNGRTYGGKGAYTYGVLDLEKNDNLYIYVGQHLTSYGSASWNSGSTAGTSSDTTNGGTNNGYGGGGATDVRLVKTSALTTWNEAASLRSRIMVAAGGGGGSNYAYPAYGGAAGGLVGYNGHNGKYPNDGVPNIPPTGATQTNGGTTSIGTNGVAIVSGAQPGSFGIGGNGQGSWGSGGGGGYYGGAGGSHTSCSVDSGAGGSSFISGYLGSVALASANSLTPRLDTSGEVCADGTTDITCSYHYSGKIFENPLMLDGESYLPTKDHASTQYGNTGNGYARITQILKDKDNYLLDITSDYGTFNKSFDPLVTEYTLHLTQYDPNFTLDVVLSQNDASVVGTGYYEIELGETLEIPLIVTSESGSAQTYNVTVVRDSYTDEHSTKLKELRLLDNEAITGRYGLNEEFNSLRYNYTANLYYNVVDLTINTATYDPSAKVQLIDNLYLTEDTGRITVRVYIPNSTVADTFYYIDYTRDPNVDIPDFFDYSYNGSYYTFVAPYTGKYLLQTWGAKGGNDGYAGVNGGYAEGIAKLNKGQEVYVVVGGLGGTSASCNGGGYNGGGNAGCSGSSGGGGGATHMATTTYRGVLSTYAEHKDELLIVAGGGGGGGNSANNAGYGGGLTGGNGSGDGGTQTAGGGGTNAGSFGQGGHRNGDGGGGGGGYYGGGAGRGDYGGGGGSSYIAVLEQGKTLYGNQAVPTYDGTSTMTGNNTNGHAKITPLFFSRDYYLTNITATTKLENTLLPVFDPLTDTYYVTMDKYDEWVTIDATLSDEKATIVGLGEYRVLEPGGEETVTLIVTAQSGEQKTYTVHIKRNDFEEDEHTTKLKDLDIVGSEDLLNPRFHSRINEYNVNISSGAIDMSIYSLPYDENAIVEITTAEEVNKIIGNDIYYIKDDSGTVYITVSLPDEYVNENDEDTLPTVYIIRYNKYGNSGGQFSYAGQYQEWIVPATGYYFLQAWGARGSNNGGNGAYTSGNIYLTSGTPIYIYIGNRTDGMAGGWNGGGNALRSDGFGGGGATDFRLIKASETKTVWNEITSLRSRIMVAAGGGGAITWQGGAQGGYGGALVGGRGANRVSGGSANTPATGGTQTTGGTIVKNGSGTMWSVSNVGGFGYGGTITNGSGTNYGGGAGGGGYWGGASGNDYNGSLNSGAGGSSYISGYLGSVAVISEDSTSPRLDANGIECTEASALNDITCSYHYSGLKFINAEMIAGNSEMPNTAGTGTMIGNSGNGYAKITPMDSDNYLLNITVKIDAEFATDDWDNVEGAKYSPEFDKFTNTYTLELPDHVTELTLGARPSSDKATVDGIGTFKVKAGENVYKILVTAESGEEREYELIVTRPSSDEAHASNITLTGFVESLCKPFEDKKYCMLSPLHYDEDTYDYYLSVPAGIRDLEWTVTKKHFYQTVIGDGVTRLGPENNTITIEVTSESENVQKQYTYHIFRDMTGDNYIDQLIINDPEIDLNFDYLLTEYSFRVDNSYTSLDMTVILDDPNATYEIIGNENFEVGANIVEIVVTAANGEKRSYVLNVYRLANGNKLLSELHVKNNGTEFELNPPFEDITTSYQLNVPNEVTNVDITAVPAYNKTKVTGTGNKQLKTGLNQINIISTAENGEAETYTIIINRAKSDNAYLSILKALEGNFNETYVKTNNEYTMTVNPYTKKLNLNIVPEEPNATYKVTGNDNFKIGENIVRVTVTAEAGNTNTYVIRVTKQGSDINTLSSLTTNKGEVSPTFTPGNNNYSITVPNDVTSITINGTMTDTLSKVVGFGTYKLTVGNNPIDITVTSETGIVNVYTVTVLREYNSNNYLSDLTVNGTTISGFDKEVTQYEFNVPNEVESVDIKGTPEVNTTIVTGNGKYELNTGNNKIDIVARAENGTYRTYEINIVRDKSTDANLESLFIQEAKIRPNFDPMRLTYTAKVMNDVESIHVIATAKDPNATVTITGPVDNLQEGDNEIKVVVTAPDGETTKEYTINVKRLPEFGPNGEVIPKLYLSDLDVSNCTLEFEKTKTYYRCEVSNEIDSVDITATAEDEEATVTGTGNQKLKVGSNVLSVIVSDIIENEEFERVYNVEVVRLKSTESRLENIIVKDHEFTPEFDPDTNSYDLTTEEYELEFEFTKMHEGETIEVLDNDNLALGANTITVRVTSEDGLHTTDYVFNVERTIRNNNYLTNLWIEDETITPEFNPLVSNYKLTVPYETTTVIIHAEAEDRNAVITGDGMKTLIVGPNTFTVRVKAENNEVREYRIIVTRLGSPNNYLSSLIVDGEEYTPSFDKTVQNYSLAVPYETDSIKVIATPEDEDATIIGDGTISLKQGVNNVEIYVTAANGNVRTYTIKVTRKDPITAKLLNIEVENYELDPEFTPDNPLYSVTVDYETTKLNFIITKMDPYSTYTIEGNRNLKIGLNDVYINVTSSNRIDTFQYHVIVNRQAYSNTFLSSLTVNQGELTPSFVKTTLTYSVEVPNNVATITLDGSPDYPYSTVSGLGDYILEVGNNPIKVLVTSPSGIKRTYNVNVTRRKSSNANIASITANIGTLEKDDDYTYTLYVPKYTTNIGKSNFRVTTEDPTATVSMPTTIDLKQTQSYPIKVTSPDGTRTKEYTVNVVFDLSHDATLAMLIPSVGQLNPEFDRLHNDYRIDLYDDEEEIYFDLYLNEVEATLLNRSLTYQLNDLETKAEIMVQAEDGTVNTYTVNIYKSLTKEKYLSNIEVTGVTDIAPDVVLPSFRAKTLEYEFEVPYEVENIGFNITKRHPAQEIKTYKDDVVQTGNSYALEVGENNFVIEVKNSIGEITNYKYKVTRAKSTNASLKELGLSTPNIAFNNFDKDILSYSTQVGYDYEDVVVHAVPEVDGARVSIQGATYLEEGIESEITITVTAPDGVTKKTYTINVIRIPEVDNLIKNITVSDRGKIKELTPKFRSGNMDYRLTVSSASNSISVDAIPNNVLTTISGNKEITTSTSGNTTTYKMEPALVTGDNVLEFYSTADFEGQTYTRTYTIVVTRVSAQNALLESLKVKNGTLVEEFEKSKENYTVNVANDVTSLDLEIVTEDSQATYVVKNNQDLGYGKENIVEIVVTSADGTVAKHYYLHVNVKGESNNYLKDIKIDGESISNFDKYIEEYEIKVENAVEAINIEGIPDAETATVNGNGIHTLDVGENDIDIEVLAQDGTPKIYTIHVTRDENAYLSNIVYILKQSDDDEGRSNYLDGFNKQVYEYELVVENEISKINIIALADDLINATITGSGEYDLKVGDNPIYLTVRNGDTRKVYTVNVKRKGSSNTNLNYLTSTDGEILPGFTNDNDEYEMHVPNYKTKLALAYEPEHYATVQVVDNELSGTESTVKVIVTAEDGTTRTISILVHLEDGGYFNSRLASLEVAEGTLAPRFDPDTYTYSVTVSQDDQNAHITAIPEETTSTVVGDGVQPLVLGRNEKKVVVTAQDGTTTTYTIVIFRKDAANADLTGLYTDIGELEPAFSPKVYNYRIDVPEETRKVHLTAVAYEEKTIVGDGDVYLGKGETVRNIVVTSESGITNTYVVTINRALSTNHDITSITESTGKMSPTYDPDTEEYGFTVGDKSTINNTYVIADKITFNVKTYSELAEVLYQVEGQEETTNNVVPLEYGDNVVYIYARSEDGNESTHYKFTIHRIHDLSNITVPGDATGPNMLDGSPNHISIQPGGTFDILSEITYDPEDADFKDLTFTSNNTSLVTIGNDGIAHAADVLDKSTTITVRSNKYPSIVKTINATVEITLITSDVYLIEREKDGYDPFITEIDIKTKLDDFLNNLDNDRRFLHVYDSSGNEITDYTKYAGTNMKVALENNGHTYDTLYLVVNGDANGDGYANVQDSTAMKNHINKKKTLKGNEFLAADVNHDKFVNVQDSTYESNYINKKKNTFLGLPRP